MSSGTRALTRLAWRDARHDRWRTLLVVMLVALPVAGLGAAVSFVDTITATPEERARDTLGRADAALEPFGPLDDELRSEVERLVPAGTEIDIRTSASDELHLPGQRVPVRLTDGAIEGDALSVGRYRLLDGRLPSDGEAVLTRRLMETTDLAIGDRVTFEGLGEVEVVGEARNRELLDERRAIVAAGFLEGPAAPVEVEHREALIGLPSDDTAAHLSEVAVEAGDAWGIWTRDEILTSRFATGERTFAIVVGGLAAVEVALIVGAAFAVSVRRRQRELGLLAAAGATTRHVRRVVLLTGATAGVVGAAIGTLLGLLTLVLATPWLDAVAGREVGGLRFDPRWLALVAVLGVTCTLVGAWWPARSVARLPITVALSGRRPSPAPSVRGLRAGLALGLLGVAVLASSGLVHGDPLAWVFLLGSVLLVLVVGLSSPWLLEQLGRLAPRLPAGPRLALRDAARFRTRNGPVLTAAMAGLAASITVVTIATTVERSAGETVAPYLEPEVMQLLGGGHALAAQEIAAELGADHATYVLTDLFVTDAAQPWDDEELATLPGLVTRGDPDVAAVLAGDDAVAALERGEVVIVGDAPARVTVGRWGHEDVADGPDPAPPVQLGEAAVTQLPRPAVLDHDGWISTPTILVPPDLVPEDAVHAAASAIRSAQPLVDDDIAFARSVAADAPGDLTLEAPVDEELPYRTLRTVTLAVGALASLTLVALAIALASAEARGDLRTLRALGADRRTRQSLAAGRALLLSGLAGLLAVPVGLVPAIAIAMRFDDLSPTVPWLAIVGAVVAVPLIATAGAALAAIRDPGVCLRTAA